MELIIGGAYQGKLTYAVSEYGLSQNELFDLAEGGPVCGFRCYYHLEAFTRRACAEWLTAEQSFGLLPLDGDAVIVSREVGSGIVPMEAEERKWRELHGGVLRLLAANAQSVTRVFCGIGVRIK